jgi:hypothetical protein
VAAGIESIVLASSRGAARYATYHAAKECGYDVTFAHIRVLRAPEYDGPVDRYTLPRTTYNEDHMRRVRREQMGRP